MKKTAVLCMFAIGLLFLMKCSKPKTTPPGGATGVTVLPWEFDITIGNYHSHFKSSDKLSPYNSCSYNIGIGGIGKAACGFIGRSKLDPEYVAGDVINGALSGFDEGVGTRKLLTAQLFQLRDLQGILISDTSFVINVKDLGKPYELDKTTAKFINGRTGLIEIPSQKLKCVTKNGTGNPMDTVCTISGKIIFSSYKP